MNESGLFLNSDEAPKIKLANGIIARPLYCNGKFMVILFEVREEVPIHSHSCVQFGFILDGRAEFNIGNEMKIVEKGCFYYIPSNIPHGVRVLKSPLFALDIFMPPREDYKHFFH